MLFRVFVHKHRYPAIDVLQSISRGMGYVTNEEHRNAARTLRNLMAVLSKNEY